MHSSRRRRRHVVSRDARRADPRSRRLSSGRGVEGPRRRCQAHHRAACRHHVLGPGRRLRLQGGGAHSAYDVAVLVGPSHFVALRRRGALSRRRVRDAARPVAIDAAAAAAIAARPDVIARAAGRPRARALARDAAAVSPPPAAGGADRAAADGLPDAVETIERLAAALVDGACGSAGRCSSPAPILSHYFDAATAASARRPGAGRVAAFDPERLLAIFESIRSESAAGFVGCGIGPAIAVMMAARALGARDARVLKYAHSGEISGDNSGVVGYLAARSGPSDAQ